MPLRTLILFGAGPGIGTNVASTFASQGPINHIILLGRNASRLETADAPAVKKAAPNAKIDILPADLSDLTALPDVLAQLDELTKESDVEVIYFNAARIKPQASALSVDISEIEEDFRLQVLSLHLISQHYLPRLTRLASSPTHKPALLVTTSHLPQSPIPQLLSLSLVKGAQRTQVLALAKEFGPGVQCGLVSVEGQVGEEMGVLNPANIAREAWAFWQRGEGREVRLREEA